MSTHTIRTRIKINLGFLELSREWERQEIEHDLQINEPNSETHDADVRAQIESQASVERSLEVGVVPEAAQRSRVLQIEGPAQSIHRTANEPSADEQQSQSRHTSSVATDRSATSGAAEALSTLRRKFADYRKENIALSEGKTQPRSESELQQRVVGHRQRDGKGSGRREPVKRGPDRDYER